MAQQINSSEMALNPRLRRWTLPSNYVGASWPEYFVFLGMNRDSDALERANFDAGLKAVGGEHTREDDVELIAVIEESHWAVGWVRWIAIHESQTEALTKASAILDALDDYPVVDEELWSEYEQEEAEQVWTNCFNVKERIAYIRKHRSEFELRNFADLLGCVRGQYFAGYASELLLR